MLASVATGRVHCARLEVKTGTSEAAGVALEPDRCPGCFPSRACRIRSRFRFRRPSPPDFR